MKFYFSRFAPNLQHYCRVCNTQLNSCKQAQIHTDGKKHEKRLSYLKFSLETGMNKDECNKMRLRHQHRHFYTNMTMIEIEILRFTK